MRDFEEEKRAIDVPLAEASDSIAAAEAEVRLAQDKLTTEKCRLLGAMVYRLVLGRNGLGELTDDEQTATLASNARRLLAELGASDLWERQERRPVPLPEPSEEDYRIFHERLRAAIEQSGMPLRAIAEATGISHTTVAAVRDGEAAMGSMRKVAVYFGVPLA